MKNNKVLYPGSFDPITAGHLDIVNRCSRLFDHIVVAVAASKNKNPLFTLAERVDMVKLVLGEFASVEIVSFDGLLIECAERHQVKIILRGLRAVSDFEYEFKLAAMNRKMAPEIETIFLTPAEHLTFLSASMVKEIAALQGDVSAFVHPQVQQLLAEKFELLASQSSPSC